MDKRALNTLAATYWSSAGWKPESEQITSPEFRERASKALTG
jgi:hypothetical protein